MRIGIIGGTGSEGSGLAIRWARAGHDVFIGSRRPDGGKARAKELDAEGRIAGGSNADAVAHGEVVVLSVPYGAHADTLKSLKDGLAGKVLVDITVPLKPPKVARVQLPEGRAAALEAQAILGDQTPVVAALHHVGAAHLSNPDETVDCDVLVCSDNVQARTQVVELLESLGVTALHAGPLDNAVALESLTPVLLFLNKKYGSKKGVGIRFTGLQ